MVLNSRTDERDILDELRAAAERLRERSEEVAAARARVDALIAGEDRSRAAASGPFAVFVLDRAGRIRGAGGAILARIGVTPEELTGQSMLDVCAEDPALVDAIRSALAGEERTVRLEIAGQVMETRTAPVPGNDDGPGGALSVWIEVTERDRAAAELEAAERELRAAVQRRADEAERAAAAAVPLDDAIATAVDERVRVMREVFDTGLRSMEEQARAAKAEADGARAAVAEITAKIEKRDDLLRAASVRERDIDGKMLVVRGELEAARAVAERAGERIAALEADLDRARAEKAAVVEETRSSLAEALADRERLEREARTATERFQIAVEEATRAGARGEQRVRAELDAELRRSSDDLRAAKRDLDVAREHTAALRAELEASRGAGVRSDERIGALELDLAETRRQLQEAHRQAAAMRASRDAAEAVLSETREQLRAAQAAGRTAQERMHAATEDAAAARAQAESALRQAEEARVRLQTAMDEAGSSRLEMLESAARMRAAIDEAVRARADAARIEDALRNAARDADAARRKADADRAELEASHAAELALATAAVEAATAEADASRIRAEEAERRLQTVAAARLTFVGDSRGQLITRMRGRAAS